MQLTQVDQSSTPAQRPTSRRRAVRNSSLAIAASVIVVAVLHARVWQVGLLEEWGLVVAWRDEGWAGYAARLGATAGRPLHLLWHYLGLALSIGMAGEYTMLGVVAVAQFVAALWALKTLTASTWLRWSLALALALHPWWGAGGTLRFLPAQVSILCLVIWFGMSLRYMSSGRCGWILAGTGVFAVGLLTYQAPLLVAPTVALALTFLSGADRRRAILSLIATSLLAGGDLVYTVKLAPLLSPDSYEASIISVKFDPFAWCKAIARTTLFHPDLVIAVAVMSAVGIVFAVMAARKGGPGAAVVFLLIVAAPFTALVYAGAMLQLRDPERVGLPMTLTLWFALCIGANLAEVSASRFGNTAATAFIVVASVCGAFLWLGHWSAYAQEQESLISAVGPIRARTPASESLIVVDHTGKYGDVYTLLPPYLDYALSARGYGSGAILCTADGVQRIQPVAAEYPISTTPTCSDVPGFAAAEEIAAINLPAGEVDVLAQSGTK